MQRDLHRAALRELRGSTTRARARVSCHENAPSRSWPRAIELGARRVVGEHASSASARPRSSVGSTSSAASPATSGIEPARAATTGTPARHRLEHREAEAFVDRRVREHRRARRAARAGPRRRRGRRARRGRAPSPGRRAIAASTAGRAGPSRPAITSRRSGCGRGEQRRTRRRGAAGSCAARASPIASTNGDAADRARRASGGMRAVVAEARDAERDHDQPARAAQARARRAPRSRRRRTPSPCARSRRARSTGARAARARALRACTARDSARTSSRRRSRASAAGSAARGSSVACTTAAGSQPAVDARHVGARPRPQQRARRPRHEARVGRYVGAHRSRAQAERVRHERRARLRAPCSAVTISPTAFPMPLRAPSSGVTSIATAGRADGRHRRFVAHPAVRDARRVSA